jgi:hypothetical protein
VGFDIKGVRGMSGSKRGEVTGGWRKLHNEEHHNLCSFSSVIRRIKDEIGRSCSMVGENACRIFVGKSERKRPLERPSGWVILESAIER